MFDFAKAPPFSGQILVGDQARIDHPCIASRHVGPMNFISSNPPPHSRLDKPAVWRFLRFFR
jgi:hypothetical protein